MVLIGEEGFGCAVAPRSPWLYLETILQGWRGLGTSGVEELLWEGQAEGRSPHFTPTPSWQRWRVRDMAWLLGVSSY